MTKRSVWETGSGGKWVLVLAMVVLVGIPGLAFGRYITDGFEYADQAAFETAWPKAYANGNILSDTTSLGTGKGLLTRTAQVVAANTKDFGANEPGIASIQIYDAGGGDVAEFLLISNDGSPYQFAAIAIDPLNSTNYRIRTYNFTGYGNGYRDTTVARSTGAHTFKIEWPTTGTVLFYIDDALVSTAYNGKTSGFDAVSLGHQSAQGTPPLNAHAFDNLNIVPEPVTLVLLGLGGLMMFRNRKH